MLDHHISVESVHLALVHRVVSSLAMKLYPTCEDMRGYLARNKRSLFAISYGVSQ